MSKSEIWNLGGSKQVKSLQRISYSLPIKLLVVKGTKWTKHSRQQLPTSEKSSSDYLVRAPLFLGYVVCMILEKIGYVPGVKLPMKLQPFCLLKLTRNRNIRLTCFPIRFSLKVEKEMILSRWSSCTFFGNGWGGGNWDLKGAQAHQTGTQQPHLPLPYIYCMWCITAKSTLLPFLQVTGLVLIHSVISAQQSFQVKRFMI